jgi:hypothetical protein
MHHFVVVERDMLGLFPETIKEKPLRDMLGLLYSKE